MKQKKNNLLLIEINECDFDYFFEGAKKFKYPNIINYFQRKKNIKTFTHDKQEGLNLDPWVQWVSVHTGLHSEQHQVYRIGQKLNDKIKQVWDVLNEKNFSSSVWGAFNSILRNKKNIKSFMPDPWSFTQAAHPDHLNDLLKLPRYYARTYPSSNKIKLILYLLVFLKKIIFSKVIFFLIKNFGSFFSIFLKGKLKSFNLYFFLDLVSLIYFVNFQKKNKSEFNIVALNCFAHYQHNYWDENNYESIYFWYLDKFIKQFEILEKQHDAVIVFNGFDQRRIPNEYHLRPKNFEKFYKILNINFLKIEPNMTAGAFIFFNNDIDRKDAIQKIKNIKIFNYPFFELVEYKDQNKIFIKILLVFKSEIKDTDLINIKNYKDLIQEPSITNEYHEIAPDRKTLKKLLSNIHFLKSTSRHKNTGNLFYQNFNFDKSSFENENFLNYKLFENIINHFDNNYV